MNDEKVNQCKFCDSLYRTYSMMVGDQSCCPRCRDAANKNEPPQKSVPRPAYRIENYNGLD